MSWLFELLNRQVVLERLTHTWVDIWILEDKVLCHGFVLFLSQVTEIVNKRVMVEQDAFFQSGNDSA
jgi:hypothetical protein